MNIKVVIADDHELFRWGFSMAIKKHEGIQLVAEAKNGRELLTAIEEYKPDVVVTDIKMPILDGIGATREISRKYPQLPVIALTMFNEEEMIIDILEAGAKAYLMKNADSGEIIEAIKAVFDGSVYYCKTTSMTLAKMIGKSRFNPLEQSKRTPFTTRELEVINLVCLGLTNKEIAERLFVSSRTIEGHRERILEKMGVTNTAGLIIYAIKYGLYVPS